MASDDEEIARGRSSIYSTSDSEGVYNVGGGGGGGGEGGGDDEESFFMEEDTGSSERGEVGVNNIIQ